MVGACGVYVSERGIEGDIRELSRSLEPFGFFRACGQRIDGLRQPVLGLLAVVEESEVRVDGASRAVGVGDGGVGEIREVSLVVIDAVHESEAGIGVVGSELSACRACQLGTPDKHTVRRCHRSGAPSRAYVDGCQRATAVEHVAHHLHVGRVERAQVEGCQPGAGIEHRAHVDHVVGVEVLQACDARQLAHAVKPPIGAHGACVGKRGVYHHLRDVGVVCHPGWAVAAHVQVIHGDALRAQVFEAVVAEGECAVAVDGIGFLRQVVGEVAGYRRAAVEAGILLVGVVLVVGCAVAAHQRCAALKHVERRCHSGGVPAGAHQDGCQLRAAVEHVLHILHLRGVPSRQVECRQLAAAGKHTLHAGDAVGAEVFNAADVRQVGHTPEPREASRGVRGFERVVEHHVVHSLAVGIPGGVVAALVQVEGVGAVAGASGVAAEGERARRRVEDDVYVQLRLIAQVSRVARRVDVCIRAVHVVRVIGGAVAALQAGAAEEHAAAHSVGGEVPSRAHADGCQLRAAGKHVRGQREAAGVEAAQAQMLQIAAVREHLRHARHLARVEVVQVQLRQRLAHIEHIAHRRHPVGVQVFQSCDVCQVLHLSKPREGACGACVGKRGVDHRLRDVGVVSEPAGYVAAHRQVVGSLLSMCVAVTVAVEGERAVGIHHIGHCGEVSGVVGRIHVGPRHSHVTLIVLRAQSAHQSGAALEHHRRLLYGRCVPAGAHVDGCELRAVSEQAVHVRHVRGVPSRQVEDGERAAVCEHVRQVREVRSVPSAQVDRLQVVASVEHPRYVGHVRGVPSRQVEAGEASAIVEHPFRFRHVRGVPSRQVQVGEHAALPEGVRHIGDVGGVELAQVEGGEAYVAVEHIGYRGQLGIVPSAQVEGLQVVAVQKHVLHGGELLVVPSAQVEAM